MPRKEFTFLVSVRVPSGDSGVGRSDTLMSARTLPRSMRASDTSRARKISRRACTYAAATSGARSPAPSIGRVTISTSGTPARL